MTTHQLNLARILSAVVVTVVPAVGLGVSWDWGKWWTYDGISGPQFWGLINPEWSLCTHGRRQSPINVDPTLILFDPNLRPIHIDKHRVRGTVNNTGHSVVFSLEEEEPIDTSGGSTPGNIGRVGSSSRALPTRYLSLNITGGPLPYRYKVHQVLLHFGSQDYLGSEHIINGSSFPAELQIVGYNSQLFNNYSEAISRANGIVAISVMVQIATERVNSELRLLTDAIENIRFQGSSSPVRQLSIRGLLPDTDHYITYEGSLTQPPCHETVTWILVNKPIYITSQQISNLRKLHQGTERTPKAKMVNNFRPTQFLHHRPLRTNIDFTNSGKTACPSMSRNMFYAANSWRR